MERVYANRVAFKDLSHLSKAYLVPLADTHYGCRDTAIDVIRGYINWIKDHDNTFTILNGDIINCAWKDSTPELYEDLITPDMAYAIALEELLPIRDKILMITRGGHEESIFRKVGIDLCARLAHDLGDIPYQPDGGMLGMRLRLDNHHTIVWCYAVHGWGGARTIGAKVKKAQDLTQVADVDVYILSHDHTQNVNRLNLIRPPLSHVRVDKPNYMQLERKLFINTGGFVSYAGYIRRKGYTPQDLGTPRIRMEVKARQDGKSHLYYKDLHAGI